MATAIARAVGLNVTLTEAIALGHDCGHGPGGHASEDAFDRFVPGGYDHAVWGADVVLTALNLCAQTLDGIRNHSWSRPAPATPEGEIVSWADRIAYCAHDLEDAVSAGIVDLDDLPEDGRRRADHPAPATRGAFVGAVVGIDRTRAWSGWTRTHADALAALRAFNYERIYNRPARSRRAEPSSRCCARSSSTSPSTPSCSPATGASTRGRTPDPDPVHAAVTYVAGMTDRFAFDTAVRLLDWPAERLPRGIDSPHR